MDTDEIRLEAEQLANDVAAELAAMSADARPAAAMAIGVRQATKGDMRGAAIAFAHARLLFRE